MYGIKVTGFNQNLCISSNEKSLIYAGKPTFVSAYYPYDDPGVKFIRQRNGGTWEEAVGSPRREIWVYSDFYSCVNKGWNRDLTDTIGFFTYHIYSKVEPLVFIYSQSGVAATVIGIEATGSTDPVTGFNQWAIKVAVGYPAGVRSGALSDMDLYCFDEVNTESLDSDTWGIELYKSGEVTFSTRAKPLVIKEIVEVSSLTTALEMTTTTLERSKSDLGSLSKQAFLSVDFARYDHYYTDGAQQIGTRESYLVWTGTGYIVKYKCGNKINYWPSWKVYGLFGGLTYNDTTQDIDAGAFEMDVISMDAVTSAPASGITDVYHSLPAYIPVIDGANYD